MQGKSLSEAEACARGWALVEALLPADFVASVGEDAEACDIYDVDVQGPSATRTALRLRLSLMLYRFAGQPPILMISIAPRPAAPGPS